MVRNKKGQTNMLMAGVVGFVVVAILAAIALTVISETKDGVGTSICSINADGYLTYNESQQQCVQTTNHSNATTSTRLAYLDTPATGIGKFTTFLPIIALVMVAVVVLGYVYLLRKG